MARAPSMSDPARLLPILARAFAELGYRGATTAALAKRCGVRENILYRAWPDKKRMFLAAIEHVYESSIVIWSGLLAKKSKTPAGRTLMEYEAAHHGEFGLYRIVFAALSEVEDEEIRAALKGMYRRFHQFIHRQLFGREPASPAQENLAWAMIGLGTVSNIVRELGLMSEPRRRELFLRVGRLLLEEK